MRIAIDLSPVVHHKAGLGRYARTLTEHLVTQDEQNTYVAFTHGKFADAALSPTLRALPRANVPLDVRPWRLLVWLAHILRVPMDRALPRADIFHATEHLLPPLKNTRTVFTLHDLIFKVFPEYHLPLNRWFLQGAMPHFLRRADAIIAVSEWTKRDAMRFYNIPPEKISVIYEAAAPALRPETDPPRIAQARARYARNQPFLLFVGVIEPRKNIVALVDALRVLRARGYPHRLLIAGRQGWLYQPTFEHIARSGMTDAVTFLDFVPDDDLRGLFAACDAFVFPSLYEGFGLPPLEAMAGGAPVVCSNASSLPEVVGDAALLVNSRDVGELANAIERVVTDRALRDELRARGFAQAAKFSWERAARETLAVYERVGRKQEAEGRFGSLAHWTIGSLAIDGRYIQDHFPGIGRYTYNLSDALARAAPDERLVVLCNPALKNTRYDLAALARHPNIQLTRVDIPTVSLAEQYQLQSPISNLQLLHSPYYIKPYLLRVPSVVTIFDLIPLVFPRAVSARARFFFRWAVWLAIKTSARVIVPSRATRDDLLARLRVPREKIAVIPLAAEARFAPQSDAAIARVREKYALAERYALYVGINKPHKNLATLLDAWARVERDAMLVIAGAWEERFALGISEQGSGVRSRGVEGQSKIRFIHDVDDADLPALYAGATVFVMPSLYEGFGLPPLEAMACGAPVICSNASALPEVVGDAARLVNPRDAAEIAQAIARVLDDAALRDDLRAKSLARAAQFSWARAARATLEVYRSLPTNKPRRNA